ncbi:hypothetical protein BBK36DRAFT_1164633 [Trichoderma citrinoviride]
MCRDNEEERRRWPAGCEARRMGEKMATRAFTPTSAIRVLAGPRSCSWLLACEGSIVLAWPLFLFSFFSPCILPPLSRTPLLLPLHLLPKGIPHV